MAQSAAPSTPLSLDDYDSDRYGPLLGVSDDGSAVAEVVRAAQASAKAQAANSSDPDIIGLIVDGERMTSGGEAPIGPTLYTHIIAAVSGAAYMSTNVSIRVNVRTDRPLPEMPVSADTVAATFADHVIERFAPFVHTPNGKPRPLRVRLVVPPDADTAVMTVLRNAVTAIEEGRRAGQLGPVGTHQLGFLVAYDEPITERHADFIESLIDLAGTLGVDEVALDGPLVPAAQARFGVQGLLNVAPPQVANRLLAHADPLKITVSPRYTFDEASGAVGVWAGIRAANSYGLTAAKYGLAPLTFAEQAAVVGTVQPWVAHIKAIPAFYADTPFVTTEQVLLSDDAERAVLIWLDMVREHNVDVVLVDCPDRIEPRIDAVGQQGPRRLIRSSDTDTGGVFTIDQISDLNGYARERGIRILWSGGITAQAAFEFGAQKVFGVFSTSSTALQIAVGEALEADPMLAAEGEPDFNGVRRVHGLLQAGFLCSALTDNELAGVIRAAAGPVLAAAVGSATLPDLISDLDSALIAGWQRHWADDATPRKRGTGA